METVVTLTVRETATVREEERNGRDFFSQSGVEADILAAVQRLHLHKPKVKIRSQRFVVAQAKISFSPVRVR